MRGIFVFLAILMANQAPAWAERDQARFQARTKASRCTPLDARKTRPQLRAFYAARKTQDHVGWCYASAAADLLSHRLGRPVSGIDLAAAYNHGIRVNPVSRTLRKIGNALRLTSTEQGAFQAGSIKGAINEAKKYGACPADRIPSHINLEAERTGYELVGLITALKDTGRIIREKGASYEDFEGSSVNINYTVAGRDCSARIPAMDLYQEFFPGLDTRQLYYLLVKKAGQDVNDTLFELTQQHCRNQRLSLNELKVAAMPISERPHWPEILDARLKRGDLVGLEHHAELLFPKQGFRDFHAVSVVARKFEGGQCKYLIRDSMADNCKAFHKKLRGGCDSKNMNVWVPETDINRYMTGLTYLK